MPKLNLMAFQCALCGMLAAPALAQDAAPPPGSPPAPAIHSTANEVALDLVVRDKKGRLVKNLSPADVEIYEDGVRQDILSLRLMAGPPPAPPSGPDPQSAEAAPPQPMPLRSLNLICIVFHNLDPGARKWAVAAAQDFIKTALPPGAWVGVFNLDSRLTPLHAFTANRDELLRAAAGAFNGYTVDIARAADSVLNSAAYTQLYTGFAHPGNRSGGLEATSTNDSVAMNAFAGVDVDTGPGANMQRGDLVIQRQQFSGIEGARQMDQIGVLIRQFAAFPGHKTVLLLSPGFTTNGEPEQFQAMLDKAKLADISIYAFDANGLNQTSTAQASSVAIQDVASLSRQQSVDTADPSGSPGPQTTSVMGGLGPMAEKSRQGDYLRGAVRTSDTQAGLRALAEGTGGFLVANSNDLRKPFQQIVEDADTHYQADYHPSSGKYDGHFRKIEVKLARPDLRATAKVDSRAGYFALPDFAGSPPLQRFEMAGLITLNARPLPHAFDFRTAAFQFRPGSANSQAAVVFELPGASLAATPQPARKSHRLHASLFAVVKDASGQIVDKFGQDFPYEVPDGQLAGIQAAPIDYTHAFNLPAGHYTVESVLFDRETNHASASTVELESPARNGIALSSVMLVARADPLTTAADSATDTNDPFLFHGRDVVPMLDESLPPSAKPLLYFVVYPDKANQETPRVRVTLSVAGEELEVKDAELPPADPSGAIPMVVSAAARPGKCEIKITALQGFQSAERSVSYTVAAR
jgi:VWFA-related protein